MNKYSKLITPLTSLVILTLGSALLTTFLSLRLHNLGVNNILVGALSTAYYGGMVLGAFKLTPIILRVGHIRAYSAFAAILTVSAILHGLYVNSLFWLVLRLIEGIATAGLYVVIESWILSDTNNSNRGTSLAIYMIALYIAQSIGQWLLNIGHQDTLILYCVSAIFAALSIIPLTLTKTITPSFSEPDALSIKSMYLISPSGVITCFVSGLILGSVYGLYPIFIQHLGYGIHQISTIMALTILGGMIFQYPFGRLSDVISRRYVIAMLAFSAVIISVIILAVGKSSFIFICILSLSLGGTVFCLYPIGISHACDRIQNNQIVSATQTLLLAYGVGATIGPIVTPVFNIAFSGLGVPVFIIISSLALGVFMLWRKKVSESVPHEEKSDFMLSAEMTPVASEMDPRADGNA